VNGEAIGSDPSPCGVRINLDWALAIRWRVDILRAGYDRSAEIASNQELSGRNLGALIGEVVELR
jgi:hypothetical protein